MEFTLKENYCMHRSIEKGGDRMCISRVHLLTEAEISLELR